MTDDHRAPDAHPDDDDLPAPATHDDDQWVTLAAAAEAVGRSTSALRKRYSKGDLTKRYDDDGRVMLDLAEVRALYRDEAPATTRTAGTLPAVWQEFTDRLLEVERARAEAEVRAAVALERETVAQERRREAEDRIGALEAELARVKDSHDRSANVTNPEPASGGSDRESVGEVRRSAPGWWKRIVGR